jgi:hypothetical protein
MKRLGVLVVRVSLILPEKILTTRTYLKNNFMKNLLLPAVFILSCAFSVSAQDNSINLPRDVAEKALEALELRPALETRITTLEKVNKELEAAKLTPCTLAAEKIKQDLTYWLNQKGDEKELRKILKFTRKNGQRLLQAQCGYDSKSALAKVWEIGKVALPIAAIFW